MDSGEVHDPLKAPYSPQTTVSNTTKTSVGSSTRICYNNSSELHNVKTSDIKIRRTRKRGSSGDISRSLLSSTYENKVIKLRWEEKPLQKTGVSDEEAGIGRHGIALSCLPYPTPDAMQHLLSLCPRCGDHHSTHTLTNLNVGDSSRTVVEMIFKASWMKADMQRQLKIEQVLKINNTGRKLSRFEDYKKLVKAKAQLQLGRMENPRCLVDGNELLRFYGTTLACPLITGLCSSPLCHICSIVCSGISTTTLTIQNQELEGDNDHVVRARNRVEPGIRTSGTCGRAHEEANRFLTGTQKRAMVVCRVIAGRIHHSPQSTTTIGNHKANNVHYDCTYSVAPPGFDSITSSAGTYYDIEDLRVFDRSAILPCFIVVYSCL